MTMLEEKFGERLWNTVRTARELGYPPITFERMLRDHSPVTVAKRLIASGDIQSGFKELVKLGRKDLTLESIMLEAEFRSLFSRGEIEAAEWRLGQG